MSLDIEAIKKRAEAATSEVCLSGHSSVVGSVFMAQPDKNKNSFMIGSFNDRADAEFYFHARTDIPDLLDELERTRAAAMALRKMAKEIKWILLNQTEWPTMATQESWNNTIQDTEWLEGLK